jgi:hypothetical protein
MTSRDVISNKVKKKKKHSRAGLVKVLAKSKPITSDRFPCLKTFFLNLNDRKLSMSALFLLLLLKKKRFLLAHPPLTDIDNYFYNQHINS